MSKTVKLLMTLFLSVCVMCSASCLKKSCEPGDTQPCFGTDGIERIQTCRDDGSGWETCDATPYSYWNDPATDLTWQDPQKDANVNPYQGLGQPDAVRYCEELVLGGYDDWRLPNIDELRTIIRGNTETLAEGDCPLHDGSLRDTMYDETCAGDPQYAGPGGGGCYWIPELTGPCDKQDIADEFNKPLETVSSTVADDDRFWVACVLFDRGSVSFNHLYSYADVRCVRSGPTKKVLCEGGIAPCTPGETKQCTAANGKPGAQVCADNGLCFGPCDSTEFTPSPPITDISDQCDQVILTIKVPEQLKTQMKMLVAFLFKYEEFSIPPQRPPDGGTDYDQIMNPDIDFEKPLEVRVPACSYYRDRCIPGGEYYLYVALLQSDSMPPWPQAGDYVWGYDQQPMTLQAGPRQVIEKEITLVPYN